MSLLDVQEMEWAERLRAKEAQRMDELERSFVERERERKAAFTSAQQDLATLEAKLRRTVAEVRLFLLLLIAPIGFSWLDCMA